MRQYDRFVKWKPVLFGLVLMGFANPAPAHVILDAPNGGEVLQVGSTFTVRWHIQIAHSLQNWDLWYSTTGLAGPWITVAMDLPAGDPSAGSVHTYDWTVPNTPSEQVRVRVRMDNSGTDYYDISNANLTISPPAGDGDPPEPNPMTWESVVQAVSTSEVTMTATPGTDESEPVEYFFFYYPGSGAGGENSGWQESNTYNDSGLDPNTIYEYAVRARDSAPTPNSGDYSASSLAATHIETPTGLTAGTITSNSIEVTATGTLTNLDQAQSGLYFEWEETVSGTPVGNSGWVQTITVTAGSLAPDTQYTIRVKARNQDALETASVEDNFTTLPDTAVCALDGDVNDDGEVNGKDAAAFLRVKLGVELPTDNPACANYGGTLEEDTAEFVGYLLNA